MNTAAFVCPLYDMKNHFDLAINLYKSKIEYNIQSDLVFIFSNEEQKEKFALRAKNELGIENILYHIIPEELSVYKSKAVVKKLYGLKEYMNLYDYIILADCESKFVRHFEAGPVAEEIWNSRNMLIANTSPVGFFYQRKCYKQMGLYYNKKLRKALGGFKYYFWFNEIQVYKCSHLPGFFDWLESFDKEKIFNTRECFEYFIFYAYLCLVLDMPIKKYHYFCMDCGINEILYSLGVKKQEKIFKDMQFHWTTTEKIQSEKICMMFHLDRMQSYLSYLDRHCKHANGANRIICEWIFIFLWKIRRLAKAIMYIIKRYFILISEIPEYILEMKKQ